uniref:DNA-directed DNA polymerase n=1 Tax=Clavaria fumosa TaxID=264083 RepID=A0A7T3PCR6_9AGAR|nr:DNA-directed DNA polymerase [Clavaria fumosa]QPZ51090.1 DNA-directed DNA polymerase [Clavaria fumosa]
MSKFKMMFLKLGIILFYSDTDSFDIDQLLNIKYVRSELGKLKLEHSFEETVYLAIKVYGGRNKDFEYVRIKGLKNPISFKDIKSLLYKNKKLEIPQEKWYRDLSKSKISIKKKSIVCRLQKTKEN